MVIEGIGKEEIEEEYRRKRGNGGKGKKGERERDMSEGGKREQGRYKGMRER